MNKTIKIIAILMMAIMFCALATTVFAAESTSVFDTSLITEIETNSKTKPKETASITALAGKVLGLIRTVAVVAAVILTSVLGIKYMMGSAEEKAGYQKSYVPLIVGIVVVAAATQLATMVFSAFN